MGHAQRPQPEPAAASGAVGRAFGSLAAGRWKSKVRGAAASMKAEYEAGKQGETSPTTPIWLTPKEQLDALLGMLRSSKSAPLATEPASGANGETDTDEAAEVAKTIGGVDWASVRAATSERTGEATATMRAMADQVDWAKVQPVAARISSALIAAVASGQIPLAGPLTSTVARAIVDQGGLAQRVAQQMDQSNVALPPDFRRAIEASATEDPKPMPH